MAIGLTLSEQKCSFPSLFDYLSFSCSGNGNTLKSRCFHAEAKFQPNSHVKFSFCFLGNLNMSKIIVLSILLSLFASTLFAQSMPLKFEVGGQLSVARFRNSYSGGQFDGYETSLGFGGRVGYNINRHFALETQLDFYPQSKDRNIKRPLTELFGVKGGRRGEKIGLFLKARPGFYNRREPNTCAPLITPGSISCPETFSRTNFILDMGGVVEFYPSKRTIIRVDIGDSLTRIESRNWHNFQSSIGFGWRF